MTAGLSGSERRLLVVLPKGIGDVVYGLALVGALKRAHRQLEITWVVQSAASPLLEGHPDVDRVVVYSPRTGLSGLRDLWRTLRVGRFDVVLNLGMYLHALPPVWFARSARTVGFDGSYARDGLPLFHRERVSAPAGAHVMDVFRAAGRHLGVEVAADWRWTWSEVEQKRRQELVAQSGVRPKVALVPCAGRPEKDWPLVRFGELAKRLRARADALILVLGGPRPEEAVAADHIRSMVPDCLSAVGDDLRRVLWILSVCDLVVAPDTGPLHLARSLGTPLVGLYGHTDPGRYGPYPPYSGIVIDRYHYDAPEVFSDRGSGGRPGRMEKIGVDDVESACLDLLAQGANSRRMRTDLAP